ncbi:hypothetical protein PVAND_001669 [Polypedilum vanderplanki]|uniref:C2H2-type domain-containing protein n=1 Tax=Polypedilum vanderplanki TaxID=319348 RepID=A0A9J6BNX1_POLVA|nr:hypothetical protein PVAND_001669 [Polypedilum vanderplanki]
MTMDIASERQVNLKNSHCDEQVKQISGEQQTTKIQIKRPFDVAFLMLPDEKLKQKEKVTYPPLTELSVRSDLINRPSHISKINNKVFIHGDYSGMFKFNEERLHADYFNSTASSEKSDDTVESEIPTPRSAFSKVPQIINIDSPIPPAVSPDQLSCSSASPPISYSPPSRDYSQIINSSAFQVISQPPPPFSPQKHLKTQNYRTNGLSSNGITNNNNEAGYLHAFQQFGTSQHPAAAFMTHPNPAAAILSTLLPTTITSLSLPAQNVCAKCNISFRMTSDLVYHMRSHHKNEYLQDPNRRKREEKLKCPVCSESFRERHHLTRHMTAHQDKEGDLLEHEIIEYHSRRK